jgi:hypothetical protein
VYIRTLGEHLKNIIRVLLAKNTGTAHLMKSAVKLCSLDTVIVVVCRNEVRGVV